MDLSILEQGKCHIQILLVILNNKEANVDHVSGVSGKCKNCPSKCRGETLSQLNGKQRFVIKHYIFIKYRNMHLKV